MRLWLRPGLSAALMALTVGITLLIVPTTPAEAAVSVGWHQVTSTSGKAVQVTSPHDGTGRLFIVALGGRIRIFQNGAVRSKPYLNISDRVRHGVDEGLMRGC
jgi:hypothetical protein